MAGSLFDQHYLTVTIDEIHELRNPGVKHFAALRLFQQALVRFGLTGTPLLTVPKVSFLLYER